VIERLAFLALVWLALTAELTLANLVLAFAVAGGVLLVTGGPGDVPRITPRTVLAALSLAAFFLYELVVASLRVSAKVLSPRLDLRPAILAVPIGLERDWEITLLANLITLTPGTLTVDVAADRRSLFVHFLDARNEAAVRREIREGFEARIRRLTPGVRQDAGGAA